MSPTKGNAYSITEIDDAVFSKELLGKGVAVKAEDSKVFSPVTGEIVTVLDSKHAIGIRTDEGVELLIHVGIDTVTLKGEPFEVLVEEGQKVYAGDELMTVNFDLIKEKD